MVSRAVIFLLLCMGSMEWEKRAGMGFRIAGFFIFPMLSEVRLVWVMQASRMRVYNGKMDDNLQTSG